MRISFSFGSFNLTPLIIAFLSISLACSQCPPATSPEGCTQSGLACEWQDTSACETNTNCSKKPASDCLSDRTCAYTPGSEGSCSQSLFFCEANLNFRSCSRNQKCLWTSDLRCENMDPYPVPECANLTAWECARNSAFCEFSGTCYDNKSICSDLNKRQCLRQSSDCHYTVTQKETCKDNTSICECFTQEQCLAKPKRCNYTQTTPDVCSNEIDCANFSAEQCPSRVCKIFKNPFTCKTIVASKCPTLTPRQCAADATCYTAADGTCKQRNPCESITDEASCKKLANAGTCAYTAGIKTCGNATQCSQYSLLGKEECLSQIGCEFTPGVGTCSAKKYGCSLLTLDQCKENQFCIHTEEIGHCENNDFGCKNLTPQQCRRNPKCLLEFQCNQLELKPCNSLSLDQCTAAPYCQYKDYGHCQDRSINCPADQASCQRTKYCQWNEAVADSCTDRFDCHVFDQEQCKHFPKICQFVSSGVCTPIIFTSDPTSGAGTSTNP